MTAITDIGVEVARAIPAELWTGLQTGAYTAHGGVIRNVAGQIVGHLAMPVAELGMPAVATVMGGPAAIASTAVSAVSGIVANAQLVSLSRDVHQVLQVAMTGTALAGLGLATSMVGFWYMNRRLNHVEDRVKELNVAVAKLKKILETAQKSKLLSAINSYKLACKNTNASQRETLLLVAQKDFNELTFFYRDMSQDVDGLAEVEIAEGFFTVACLGDAVCTSDLGMYDDASENLSEHFVDWQGIARKHIATFLDLENPARLLEARYVKDLPTEVLVRILDFANADVRGIEWMDVLRGSIGTMKWPQFSALEKEKIAFAKALQSRNEVLGSFSEHFQVLAALKAPVTEYARQLMEQTKDGYAVLNLLPEPLAA